MPLLACALAASARAKAASFCASWASSVSDTRRASTSPLFTRMPSSARTSVTRRPSTSGPTRTSSRAASEPVTSTVSVKCARSTRATVTGAASASSAAAWPARLGDGCTMSASATPTAANSTMTPTISFLSITPSREPPLLRLSSLAGVKQGLDQLEGGGQYPFRVKLFVDRAAPEHAVRHHQKGLDGGRNIERRRDTPLLFEFLEERLKAVDDIAIEATEDLTHALIARGLQADIDGHAVVLGRVLEEILLAEGRQRLHKIRRAGQSLEPLGKLLPIALGNARNQRLLAVEVDVKSPRADGRRAADVLHGRAMKASVCNAALGGIQNVLAARLLRFGLKFRHCSTCCFPPRGSLTGGKPPSRGAQNKTNGRFICNEGGGLKATPRDSGASTVTSACVRGHATGCLRQWQRYGKKEGTSAKCLGAPS